MSKHLAIAFVLGAVACGGGEGAGPVSMEAAQAGCTADCEHQIECGDETPLGDCTADCVGDVTGILRADVFADLVDCRTELACGASTSTCNTCEPTSSHTAYETRCRELFAPCTDGSADLDNLCGVSSTSGDDGSLCMFATNIMDELTACMPSGAVCETALGCMRNVLTSHGIG